MTEEPVNPTLQTDPVAPIEPEAWLDHHGDYLFRFAMSRVRRADVTEELVRETLLAALKGREAFGGRASERSWLTAILEGDR